MTSKNFRRAVLGLLLFFAGAAQGAGIPARLTSHEVIVKLRTGMEQQSPQGLLSPPRTVLEAITGESAGLISADLPRWYKIRLKGSLTVEDAVKKLRAMKVEIEFAEPNWIYRAEVLPETLKFVEAADLDSDDAVGYPEAYLPAEKRFNRHWHIQNTGQPMNPNGIKGKVGADTKLLEAWRVGDGVRSAARHVTVAVIDTGVAYTHKDLVENLWQNPGESGAWTPSGSAQARAASENCRNKNCNGIDDDANGFVDDVIGWNFVKNNQKPMDDNTHGTHVAGIIGASHNKKGVVGANHRVRLMGLKFLDKNGSGTLEAALKAIVYAADNGADVINASWGGGGESQALAEAIQYAIDRGVLFVAAAGNASSNNDYIPTFPANYPGVFSVAASDPWDGVTAFSSYGKKTTHIAAPGVDILSTLRRSVTDSFPLIRLIKVYRNTYGYLSGTSMATPLVAGVAAMLIGIDPVQFKGKPTAVMKRLMESSDIQPATISKTISGGRINAYNAVKGIKTAGHNRPSVENWSELVKAPLESPHPYVNRAPLSHTIRHPGAKWIRVVYGRYGVETFNDQLEIRDANDALVDALTGFGTQGVSYPIEGDEVRLVFNTNARVDGWGYEILGYQYMN